MLHPPPAKINTARRASTDFLATAPAVPPGRTHQTCKSRDTWPVQLFAAGTNGLSATPPRREISESHLILIGNSVYVSSG
jgi:hypothetical protein